MAVKSIMCIMTKEDIINLSDIIDSSKTTNNDQVIGLDRLFEDEEEVIDAYEEDQKKEEEKQKKITKIQIGLIVFLVIFSLLVYFFGYNIVEPFIKID